jgi:hypothetical protein
VYASVMKLVKAHVIERAVATSHAAIAAKLNERGVRTRAGRALDARTSRRRAGAGLAGEINPHSLGSRCVPARIALLVRPDGGRPALSAPRKPRSCCSDMQEIQSQEMSAFGTLQPTAYATVCPQAAEADVAPNTVRSAGA